MPWRGVGIEDVAVADARPRMIPSSSYLVLPYHRQRDNFLDTWSEFTTGSKCCMSHYDYFPTVGAFSVCGMSFGFKAIVWLA